MLKSVMINSLPVGYSLKCLASLLYYMSSGSITYIQTNNLLNKGYTQASQSLFKIYGLEYIFSAIYGWYSWFI